MSYPRTGLSTGTYYAGVRSKDNYGNYSSWTTGSVIVGPVLPPTATLWIAYGLLKASWTQAPAQNTPYSYIVNVGTSPGASNISTQTTAPGALYWEKYGLPVGSYYVSIYAKDSQNTVSTTAAQSAVQDVVYGPPKPTGSISVSSGVVTASWSAVDGIAVPSVPPYTYQVKLQVPTKNEDPVPITGVGSATSFSTTLTTGNYDVYCRSLDGGFVPSDWSFFGLAQVQAKVLEQYQYNLVGQATSFTDAKSQVTLSEHGLFGVTKETASGSSLVDVTYQYNALGSVSRKAWTGTAPSIDYT